MKKSWTRILVVIAVVAVVVLVVQFYGPQLKHLFMEMHGRH